MKVVHKGALLLAVLSAFLVGCGKSSDSQPSAYTPIGGQPTPACSSGYVWNGSQCVISNPSSFSSLCTSSGGQIYTVSGVTVCRKLYSALSGTQLASDLGGYPLMGMGMAEISFGPAGIGAFTYSFPRLLSATEAYSAIGGMQLKTKDVVHFNGQGRWGHGGSWLVYPNDCNDYGGDLVASDGTMFFTLQSGTGVKITTLYPGQLRFGFFADPDHDDNDCGQILGNGPGGQIEFYVARCQDINGNSQDCF